MSEAGALRSFVVEALAGLGAAISEGGSLVWVRAPESLQRDLEVAANFALASWSSKETPRIFAFFCSYCEARSRNPEPSAVQPGVSAFG